MKLNQNKPSTPPQISDYEAMNEEFIEKDTEFRIYLPLHKPNPPTEGAVNRAKFVDKTYQWQGR